MPTSDGLFKGISVSAEAWNRIFGTPEEDEAFAEMERRKRHNEAIEDASWPHMEVTR